MNNKEAKARIKINKLLEMSGWRLLDDGSNQANISLENNVKLTVKKLDEFGEDLEKTANGYIDFLLLDENKFPLVVLEAKSEDKDPLDGKEQARRYAQSQNVRFIILSNGNIHYFWDLEKGNPTVITKFPTSESLKHFEQFKPDKEKLAEEKVDKDYVVLTQYPEYKNDPRWKDEEKKPDLIDELGLKFLRPYQLNAIKSLQASAKDGNDRFLFEMATGTGKTLVSAGVIKLFLRSGNAKRILFLVDRLELEDQAWKSFAKILKNDYTCVIYKENKSEWTKAEIVVSTVQSLTFNDKYKKLFSPTDFDLVISDEAHRSISGNARALFEYFVGYKLGLTATPKDYLKNLPTELNDKDPRAWERRQLLDTYKTFGCESGVPTFRYSLLDGVGDKYLVNPIVVDARTEITTQLLSDQGYSLMVESEDGTETEEVFTHKDFEKKFFSEKTNQIFCKTFLENALRDPLSKEVGKGIVFAVSQKHASKITQILNQLAEEMFPGKYNSDFAIQITSNITDAQQFTVNFANNNLNGHTRWLDSYKSSKSRICVTVGMMTTGYDCQDLLNIALMRPIFSPTDFIQIKGRGTRKYTFSYVDEDKEVFKQDKSNFKLFDFFANCEYFEEKFDYDQVMKLPLIQKDKPIIDYGPDEGTPPQRLKDGATIYNPDPLKTMVETPIGVDGMKVDWKLFEKFEQIVKADQVIKEKFEKGDLVGVEEHVKEKILDKPEEFISLDKLRKAVKADRRITLREFIEKALGTVDRFKPKDELLDEEVDKFLLTNKPESRYVPYIRNYMKAYITDPAFRQIVEQGHFQELNFYPGFTMTEYKSLNGYQKVLPEYIKDYVSLNRYM